MQQTKQATLEFVLHRPRPPDDPHAGQFAFADPPFAAWGRAG